jgi:hypothetical protein
MSAATADAENVVRSQNDYAARMDAMRVTLAHARGVGAWDGFSISRAIDFLHSISRFTMGELIEIAPDAAAAEVEEPSEIH